MSIGSISNGKKEKILILCRLIRTIVSQMEKWENTVYSDLCYTWYCQMPRDLLVFIYGLK